jgi:two-component system OmpR family response regulator
MLKLEGYRALKAYSASEGMDVASREHPDMISVDLRMPVVDGAAMLQQLRSVGHLHEVPVIMITGDYLIDATVREQIQVLGADLVFKPLWIDDLLALVKTHLERQRPNHH